MSSACVEYALRWNAFAGAICRLHACGMRNRAYTSMKVADFWESSFDQGNLHTVVCN
jgi:hypothetical protein